jgi:hypothetical protein
MQGLPSLTVSRVVALATRDVTAKTQAPKHKKSLTWDIIKKFIDHAKQNFLDVRDITMFVFVTLAMLREDNVLRLDDEDVKQVTTGDRKLITLFLTKSKTDQKKEGHTVVLGSSPIQARDPVTWYTSETDSDADDNEESKVVGVAR